MLKSTYKPQTKIKSRLSSSRRSLSKSQRVAGIKNLIIGGDGIRQKLGSRAWFLESDMSVKDFTQMIFTKDLLVIKNLDGITRIRLMPAE